MVKVGCTKVLLEEGVSHTYVVGGLQGWQYLEKAGIHSALPAHLSPVKFGQWRLPTSMRSTSFQDRNGLVLIAPTPGNAGTPELGDGGWEMQLVLSLFCQPSRAVLPKLCLQLWKRVPAKAQGSGESW